MRTLPNTKGRDSPDTRRTRLVLGVIGGMLIAIAVGVGARSPHRDFAVSLCALIGALLVGLARFAPDRWIRRAQELLLRR